MTSYPFQTIVSPGPVAAGFSSVRNLVDGIMGPIGSAKSTEMLMKGLRRAYQQKPGPDGVRRYKRGLIRKTTREIERTVLPTWLAWVPKELGSFTGGSGGVPATHELKFRVPDGTIVEATFEFIGLGDHRIEDVLRSWFTTDAAIDEADLLHREALMYLIGRCGRYPRMSLGGPTGGYGVDLAFNAPDTENYLYDMLVENPEPGFAFHRQPGGLVRIGNGYQPNPRAENLHNLPEGYYLNAARGQPAWYVQRMILNEFGFSREGLPVYPEYEDSVHCAPVPLEPIDAPLVIGADADLHPAIVIGQRDSFGQIRWLDELVAPDGGIGAERFAPQILDLLSEDRYRQFKKIEVYHDPSQRRSGTDEQHWAAMMAAKTKDRGLIWRPAPTNNLHKRLECVRGPLMRTVVIGDRPQKGLIISPRCKTARKGFNSAYRLIRHRDATGRVSDEPEKSHPFSDVHDAGQYVNMGLGELDRVMGYDGKRRAMQSRAADDDMPAEYERAGSPYSSGGYGRSNYPMQDRAIDD